MGARRAAERLARVADAQWLRIADDTGWFPRSKIHVVVVDDSDQLSAFALPHWNWIVLSAHPGVELYRIRGRAPWAPDALAHELAHVFGHEISSALAEVASGGFEVGSAAEIGSVGVGAQVTLAPNEPYWWSEGAAEYWSELAGVNTWSTGRDAELRVASQAGRLLDFDEWGVSQDKGDWGDPERAYQQGYAFARWLADRYGPDTFAELAWASRERYRPSWHRLLEQRTGVPARELFAQFRAEMNADYALQVAQKRARGIVAGDELERWPAPWNGAELSRRDRDALQSPREREAAREGTGTWELHPRLSQDGRWLVEGRAGWVRVQQAPEFLWPALTGVQVDAAAARDSVARAWDTTVWLPAALGSAPSFVAGQDALVVAAPVDTEHPSPLRPDRRTSFTQLYRVDLTPDTRRERWRGEHRERPTLARASRQLRRRYVPIPGTLRAFDPAVSPDGTRVAFVQVRDGTANLVVSGLDGSERRDLSTFDDGTWLQGPAWSPDGSELVVSMLRTDQPNLWRVDPDNCGWSALTADAHDELDPVWTDEGIWFAADPDGAFDIYRLDPDGHHVERVTHVIGGAHTPSLSPAGHLLYTERTAYGWKAMGLRRSEFAGWDASDRFVLHPPAEDAAADLAFRPPAVEWTSRPYRAHRNVLPPLLSPQLRVDVTEDRVLPRAGAWLRVRDAVELHELTVEGWVGEDWIGGARWAYRGLEPELAVWAQGASDRRRLHRPDVRFERRTLAAAGGTADWLWSEHVTVRTEAFGLRLGLPDTPDLGVRLRSVRTGVSLQLGAPRPRGSSRGGAQATVGWTHAWSHAATETFGAVEDGERLDRYTFHRLQTSGAATVRTRIATGPLDAHRHRLEFTWAAGWTSRNVLVEEELRAGGDVPTALRPTAIERTVPMPGFAPYAISGEQLAVASAGWVVPIAPRLRTQLGPAYFESIEAVISGHLGNAWSARDGALERPGFDTPSDHGHPVLADVAAEVRVGAIGMDSPWDSFVRVAWGLQDLGERAPGGQVPEAAGRATGGPRLMVGLGTGW